MTKKDEAAGIRIWMDGVFDLMHYGHVNAFRQGLGLGTYLIVGVNSDESIAKCKGEYPVLCHEERVAMVRSCKFVDQVVEQVPYVMNEDYLSAKINELRIDYIVHGDDACIVNGKDVYETAKKMNKFKMIPRTQGVSTTDLLGRMLLIAESHVLNHDARHCPSPRFFMTSRLQCAFSNHQRQEGKNIDHVVYIAGAFDLFHPGHVELLRHAKRHGKYLLVGLFSDQTLMQIGRPQITHAHERLLNLLGCNLVDDVLLDAPLSGLDDHTIDLFHIDIILAPPQNHEEALSTSSSLDPYAVAKRRGRFHSLDFQSSLTVHDIAKRIHLHYDGLLRRYNEKRLKEEQYYAERYDPSSSS